jgi:Ca2+-binding RTX toxin-like protein
VAATTAAPAHAGTVDIRLGGEEEGSDPLNPDYYWVIAFSGGDDANAITVTQVEDGSFLVTDTGETLDAGSGCAQAGTHAAICTEDETDHVRPTRLAIGLGAGDDSVEETPAWMRLQVSGGPGEDTVEGSDGADELHGGEDADELAGGGGKDVVEGGPGPDLLAGGDGDDSITGGSEADDLDGGPGTDTVSYREIAQDVTVDLATGLGGDGDQLAGFESAIGGDGGDTLTGTDERNVLDGGPGDDIVDAAGGDDVVTGGHGENQLTGGGGRDIVDESWQAYDGEVWLGVPGSSAGSARFDDDAGDPYVSDALHGLEGARTGGGDDLLTGDDGPNLLDGGTGDDDVRGLGGDDDLLGGSGDDRLDAGVGADYVDAWAGADVSLGGPGDDILRQYGELSTCCGRGDTTDDDGPDHISGGDGIDLVDYSTRYAPVIVDLSVSGGQGEPARDQWDGPENDVIEGVESAVTGLNDDVLRGGQGFNVLDAGPGSDRIEARDGAPDDVRCGDGSGGFAAPDELDTAVVDAVDSTTGCERVELPASGAPPEPPAAGPEPPGTAPPLGPVPPPATDPAAALAEDVANALARLGSRAIARWARKGRVLRVPVQLVRPGTLSVVLRIAAGPRAAAASAVLARGGARRSTPGRATLRLRLTRAGRRLLRSRSSRRLRVSIRFVDGSSGRLSVASRSVRGRTRRHL